MILNFSLRLNAQTKDRYACFPIRPCRAIFYIIFLFDVIFISDVVLIFHIVLIIDVVLFFDVILILYVLLIFDVVFILDFIFIFDVVVIFMLYSFACHLHFHVVFIFKASLFLEVIVMACLNILEE